MSFWSSRKQPPLMFSHAVAYESSVLSDQLLLRLLFQISMVLAYESLNYIYTLIFLIRVHDIARDKFLPRQYQSRSKGVGGS